MTENYDTDYNAGWSRYKTIVEGYAPRRQEETGEVMIKNVKSQVGGAGFGQEKRYTIRNV
jgi:hypothetical protein